MATPNLTAGASGLSSRDRATRRLVNRATGRTEIERIARILAAATLLVFMAVGSVAIWTAVPLVGLWIASQLTDSYPQLAVGPTLAAAFGIPGAMVLGVKGLALLENSYERRTGKPPRARVMPVWRRSIRDSRSHVPASVLEKLMVANVLIAVSGLVLWFFVFAGSSLICVCCARAGARSTSMASGRLKSRRSQFCLRD